MNKVRIRRDQRGAIFVEAIVVISVFTLCFLGVLYFRQLYVGKLAVQRLARTSIKVEAPSSELANDVINAIISSTSLDEVTAVSLFATASATTQRDPLSPKQGFESDVSSESFVSCMAPVSDEQFGQIIPHVKAIFGSIFD